KDLKSYLQGRQIRIGRSRSAQYGEAEFEWLDDAPQELNERVEWDGFDEQHPPSVSNSGERLIITTLSPLLTVNDYGHPEAYFPENELAQTLDMETSELKLCSSYTRTEVIGGYNSHLRLPRQQWPATAPGSVFVFKAEKVLDQERLLQLEHNGLGLRKGEGFGRIAVNRQGSLDLIDCEEVQLDDPEKKNRPDAPDLKMPQSVQDLLYGVVRSRCLTEMQQRAITIARSKDNIPSNALLGRMRSFLRQNSRAESLEQIRDPAKNQLTDYQIDMRDFGITILPTQMTIYELFEKAWTEPESLTRQMIEKYVQELIADQPDETRQTIIEKLVANDSEKMCTVLLDYLLTVLRRKSR
ncbi:MAG: hypothetical protein J4F29_14680, partial [Candidatus Latescibacteria bacterium]|nr:hypothetical protein [Candidatus Latescibacterota bacterium]